MDEAKSQVENKIRKDLLSLRYKIMYSDTQSCDASPTELFFTQHKNGDLNLQKLEISKQ